MNVDIMFMMYIGTKFEDPETIARQRPKKEKEKEKQVGNYVFSAPVFVIAQGQLNYSTAKIENIKELKKFLNETKNMEMLENKGFDSNFLNQIKSDVDKKHNQYSKDINMNVYTNTKNALSNFNSSLNLSKSSQIEKKYNDFEKKIAYTPMEKKLENQLQKVAQTTTTQPKEVKKVEDKFSKGTLAWIKKEGLIAEKIFKAKELMDKDSEVKTKTNTNLGEILSQYTAGKLTKQLSNLKLSLKEMAVVALLYKDKNADKLKINEERILTYHSTMEGEKQASEAYAIWKGGKSKEKELQMAKNEIRDISDLIEPMHIVGSTVQEKKVEKKEVAKVEKVEPEKTKTKTNMSIKVNSDKFSELFTQYCKDNNIDIAEIKEVDAAVNKYMEKEVAKLKKNMNERELKSFAENYTKKPEQYYEDKKTLKKLEESMNQIIEDTRTEMLAVVKTQVELAKTSKATQLANEIIPETQTATNVETAKVVDVDYSKYTAEEINKLTPEQIEKLTLENIKAMEDILLGDGINMNVFDAIAKRETELKKIGNN